LNLTRAAAASRLVVLGLILLLTVTQPAKATTPAHTECLLAEVFRVVAAKVFLRLKIEKQA